MTMLKLIVSILSIGLSSSLQSHLYARSPRWSELSATTAADIASKSSHTIMKIPPVRALMLTTAWKNDAENLRALGKPTNRRLKSECINRNPHSFNLCVVRVHHKRHNGHHRPEVLGS